MNYHFGIIGYGRMAEIAHQKIIQFLPKSKLTAVFDTTPVRRTTAEQQGLTAYDSIRKFLNHPELDIVVIATPSVTHHKFVIQSLNAGKHVLVEKPMAMNAKQAEEMIQCAKKNKRYLTVFHNRRYDSDFLTIKKIVQSGKLGKILAIESRVNYWGSPAGFGTPGFYQNWRNEKKWGGGALYDWGSHLIDQILQLVDAPIRSVSADLQSGLFGKDVDDYVFGMIKFQNGITGIIEVNYMTFSELPRWRLIAEKGTVLSDIKNSGRLLFYTPKNKSGIPLRPVKGNATIIYQSLLKAIKQPPSPYQGEGMGVRWTPLAVTPESVYRTMQVMDAFFQSAKSGKNVKI